MKAMQKRFNILVVMLTFIVLIGLIVQYNYLNKITTKAKQNNIITTREHLAEVITIKINSYHQYINVAGELIGADSWDDDEIKAYMMRVVKSDPLIKSVYYGTPMNKLINSDNWLPPKDYNVTKRPWYIKAVEENKLVVSDIYAAVIDGSTVISISKPVYNENKEFMGVVSGDIAASEIIKIVEGTKVQGSGYSFLIDGKGNLLAHPKYKYNLGSGLVHIDSLGPGIHKEMQNIKMGQIEVELDGVQGYLTYRPLQNTNWVIGNFISLKDFKGDNKEMWRMFFIALIIFMAMFISFSYLQRKNFLIPLINLDQDIRKINLEKNIAYRIPLEARDSFREIKQTLNLVLSKTQDLVEQVEQDKLEIMAQNDELNYLSYNDQLTGLYNRRYFEEKLEQVDREENLPISLIMGDANGLKLINDSFGHKAGDKLLITIANMIKQGCRADDIVCRISGDEFVVILPKTKPAKAKQIINKIETLSEEGKVVSDRFSNIEISVSYGLATKDHKELDILNTLKVAEEQMYSKKLFEGPQMRRRTIKTIMEELYLQDKDKKAHCERVASISQEIGVALGMDQSALDDLTKAARLHDIGEIAISQEILDKKDKLSRDEWAEIKKHPEIGYRILSTLTEMSNIAEDILAHHEWYDGTGYPKGLKEDQIPLKARIIAIAEAYDAMGSNRPYRKALDQQAILGELLEKAGSQFDPQLTKLFVEKILKQQWLA